MIHAGNLATKDLAWLLDDDGIVNYVVAAFVENTEARAKLTKRLAHALEEVIGEDSAAKAEIATGTAEEPYIREAIRRASSPTGLSASGHGGRSAMAASSDAEDSARLELESRLRQQEAVAQLGQYTSASQNDLLDQAVSLVAKVLSAEYCKFLELLPESDGLLLRAGVGWKEGTVGTALVCTGSDSQDGFALISQTPVIVDDLRTETRFSGPRLLVEHDVISGISVVVRGRDGPLGVLGVHSASTRSFDDGDARFLQSVANVLSAAIERQRIEAELRESETRLANILGTASDAIVSVDEEFRVTLFDRGAEKLFGYEADEILGQPLDLLIPTDEIAVHREHLREFRNDSEATPKIVNGSIVRGRRKDTSTFPAQVEISKTVVDGRTSFTAVVRDITVREELAKQRLPSRTPDAVGHLVGGIAHDFNNLLTGILGFAVLALESIDPEHPAFEDITEIIEVSERAELLIRQLLAFSSQQVLKPVVMDVNGIVQNLTRLLRRLLPEHVDIVLQLDPEVENVKMIPGQIEQVIVNLALNGGDAMPAGGTLTIASRDVTFESGFTREGVVVDAGAYYHLSVSDTGSGMTPETRRHVFEPFFTTKPHGKGMGLGLPTVHGIVKQTGGYIFIDSALDQGTTVDIYLPLTNEPRIRLRVQSAPES